MARSRNIKPGFFTNEELVEIDPLGRLLFIGLWTIADREGRLEDRPKKIKMEILPCDNCDVDCLLQTLTERGFLLRYKVEGKSYIQILNFSKHQNPHIKEAASTIPAPNLHDTCTVQAPIKKEASHADSLLLVTDSFNLKRDSDDNAREAAPVDKSQKPDFPLLRELEHEHGILSSVEISCLTEWHESFSADILAECFKRYKDNGGKNRGYMDSIFVNWLKAGVKGMADVQRQDELFEQGKRGNTPRGKPSSIDNLMKQVLGGTSVG